MKQRLGELVEVIRYSDPVSHASLRALDRRVEAVANALADKVWAKDSVSAESLCDELEAALEERNRQCALLK